jgi:ABC-type nitrate/sulfonate/bicarbonate transport system substrate-binding protein
MTTTSTTTGPGTTPDIDHLYFTRCPVPTAIGLAADTGLLTAEFAPDGIAVSSLQEAANRDLATSHYDHRLLGLVREGGNMPALWARSSGASTRLVAITWVDEYQAILSLPGSGITEPADLADRRVGIPRLPGDSPEAHRRADVFRGMALHGFASALGLAGLTLDDVELVDVERPGDRGDLASSTGSWADGTSEHFALDRDALLAGTVDAIYVKGVPGVLTARQLRAVEVVDVGSHPDPLVRVNNGTPRPITVDQGLLERRPDLVDRFLAVALRTVDHLSADPAGLERAIATETGAQVEVRSAYARLEEGLLPNLSELSRQGLAHQAGFLLRHGFLEGPVDVEAWIDPGPLARAQELADRWR